MATSTLGSGTLVLAGTTSGTTTVTATAVAGTTTLTLPAATDTLVGKATTDTLTNKTLTGAVMNGTLGATTPSTVAATTISASSTATFAAGAVGTPSITTTGDTNTGIFFPAADTIAFAEGGAESMRIDSSGNVGVGTTAPQTPFGGRGLQVGNTSDGRSLLTLQASATGQGSIYFSDGTSGGDTYVGFIDYYHTTNYMAFGTGAAERARIDASGNLLVGTTSGTERFCVTTSANASTAFFLNNNGTAANQYGIVVKLNGDPNNTNHMVQCLGGTTERATIRANGGLANYSANNVNLSDRREKTNFAPAKSYLETICAIPVQTFNYADQNMEDDPGLTLGVVAQDVQAVAPELVMESNWGTEENPKMRLSIYQTDLQYALMKCIQEMKAIIDTQASTITQLTARITALESA